MLKQLRLWLLVVADSRQQLGNRKAHQQAVIVHSKFLKGRYWLGLRDVVMRLAGR